MIYSIARVGLLAAVVSTAVGLFNAGVERARTIEDVSLFESDSLDSPDVMGPCLPDGAEIGPWTVVFGGYGCVKAQVEAGKEWFLLAPQAVADSSQTSASLVVGPQHGLNFAFAASMITDTQLRQGASPNVWETAWIVWDYTDNEHFYYAIMKPNGWEIGKRDPAYPGGQRFLVTGNTPTYPIGEWHRATVIRKGARTRFLVDGLELASFQDSERPYKGGRVGLYTEDAAVRFRSVSLREE